MQALLRALSLRQIQRDLEEPRDRLVLVPEGGHAYQDRKMGPVLADIGALAFLGDAAARSRDQRLKARVDLLAKFLG